MAKSSTSFDKDKQPKERKPRGKAKRTLIIEALKANNQTEESFFQAMVQKAMFGGADGDGDSQMMREVASRLFPSPKSTMPIYQFEFPANGTMVQKADAIISAVSGGELPIDAGKYLFDILTDRAMIEEKHELADRVAKIEQLLESVSNGDS